MLRCASLGTQGSSPLTAPDGKRRLTHQTLNRALITTNPITLFYTSDERFLWGSSWTTVFKVARSKSGLEVVDFVPKPSEAILQDKFHGAYSLLTEEVRRGSGSPSALLEPLLSVRSSASRQLTRRLARMAPLPLWLSLPRKRCWFLRVIDWKPTTTCQALTDSA